MPIEERLLEEKRHHAGTSYSRIFIDMISIARRKLLMLSGVLVLCRCRSRGSIIMARGSPRLSAPELAPHDANPKPDGIFGKDTSLVEATP